MQLGQRTDFQHMRGPDGKLTESGWIACLASSRVHGEMMSTEPAFDHNFPDVGYADQNVVPSDYRECPVHLHSTRESCADHSKTWVSNR